MKKSQTKKIKSSNSVSLLKKQSAESNFNSIFNAFNKLNVVIIGDVMVDAYMWGNVNRISPEAPVPIVSIAKKENRLGGAANVALNVQALGANPILCAMVGLDEGAVVFADLMKKQGLSAKGILKSKTRTTTVKTRVIGNNHQLIRVDEEIETPLTSKEEQQLIEQIKKLISSESVDVIVFEDYDKGCITLKIIQQIVAFAKQKNIPVVVDPKKKNFMAYTGVTLFKPNLKELKEGLKLDNTPVETNELKKVATDFIKKQNIDTLLITLSEKGVYTHSVKEQTLIPAHVRNISDVSGAGDTVISVAALCVALRLSASLTATLANLAGGLVCEKVGVVPIDKKQLLDEANKLS